MTKPLAMLVHDKATPGTLLARKFGDLDYRVVILADPALLAATVAQERPMIVVADLTSRRGDVLAAITALLAEEGTAHVAVIAYTAREDERLRENALKAGIKILATDATVVPHLEQFVEHALLVE